jgi:hypothetical protein
MATMPRLRWPATFALAAATVVPLVVHAQQRKLLVVSTDSQPIIYAYVTVNGGVGIITDERGEVSLGAGRTKTVTLNVRRIGYAPWFGQLTLPDTAAVLRVTLGRIAQSLATVSVSGSASRAGLSLTMKGFYDRWEMRQKGLLSATFIGPEELEFRHPDKITNMLRGLNGVSFRQSKENEQVAFGLNNQCQMAIVIDGIEQCPVGGCNASSHGASITPHGVPGSGGLSEQNAVLIDRILEANDISAIEVYPRGGNMPVSLQIADPACGVIAFWTGSRKP